MWGSEFTIKAATLQRDSVEFIPGPMLVEVDPVEVTDIRQAGLLGWKGALVIEPSREAPPDLARIVPHRACCQEPSETAAAPFL